ncbi:MAG: amino acid transport protein [Planctomycetes bacterium]|nr:amino acid transport protein [Planctomycetota bacterium]
MIALQAPADAMAAVLIAGFVVSTVGLGLFIYGKKQHRAPQMAGGLVMMALPMCGVSALAVWLLGVGVVAGVFGAVRIGW